MSDIQPDPYIDGIAAEHVQEYEPKCELPWTAWKSAPGDMSWEATCDWGDCDEPTVTVRWEDRLKRWLCVCAGHGPDQDARCAALHPSHQARECAADDPPEYDPDLAESQRIAEVFADASAERDQIEREA